MSKEKIYGAVYDTQPVDDGALSRSELTVGHEDIRVIKAKYERGDLTGRGALDALRAFNSEYGGDFESMALLARFLTASAEEAAEAGFSTDW